MRKVVEEEGGREGRVLNEVVAVIEAEVVVVVVDEGERQIDVGLVVGLDNVVDLCRGWSACVAAAAAGGAAGEGDCGGDGGGNGMKVENDNGSVVGVGGSQKQKKCVGCCGGNGGRAGGEEEEEEEVEDEDESRDYAAGAAGAAGAAVVVSVERKKEDLRALLVVVEVVAEGDRCQQEELQRQEQQRQAFPQPQRCVSASPSPVAIDPAWPYSPPCPPLALCWPVLLPSSVLYARVRNRPGEPQIRRRPYIAYYICRNKTP